MVEKDWLDEIVIKIEETFDGEPHGNDRERQKVTIIGERCDNARNQLYNCNEVKVPVGIKEENQDGYGKEGYGYCNEVKEETQDGYGEEGYGYCYEVEVEIKEENQDGYGKEGYGYCNEVKAEIKEENQDGYGKEGYGYCNEVKAEIKEGNHDWYGEMVCRNEETTGIDNLAMPVDEGRYEETVEETVKAEAGRRAPGSVWGQAAGGPAVIVQFVPDIAMDTLNDSSFENLDFERNGNATLGRQRNSTMESDFSLPNNMSLSQRGAYDVINSSNKAAAPMIRNEKKNQNGQVQTCNHLHNELDCHLCALLNLDMKRATIIHNGAKTFACPYCDYRTHHKASVKVHIRIHIGDKPYACDRCEYRSTQKCHLNTHMLTHTDRKPFKCKKCGYRGRTSSNLRSHMNTHARQNRCQQTREALQPV